MAWTDTLLNTFVRTNFLPNTSNWILLTLHCLVVRSRRTFFTLEYVLKHVEEIFTARGKSEIWAVTEINNVCEQIKCSCPKISENFLKTTESIFKSSLVAILQYLIRIKQIILDILISGLLLSGLLKDTLITKKTIHQIILFC